MTSWRPGSNPPPASVVTGYDVSTGLEAMRSDLYRAECAALRSVKYRCAWRDEKNIAAARYTAAALLQAKHDRIAREAERAYMEFSRARFAA